MSTHTDTPAVPGKIELTVFMLVKSSPEWLALSQERRVRMLVEHVEPILRRHEDEVKVRFYDVEFYSARVTDIWLWEATSHRAYQSLVEALRDTPMWDRYFDIVEILPAVQNGYDGDLGRRLAA
ncbi:MAG: darcynin family protein [Caulobacteraceae bacterium]